MKFQYQGFQANGKNITGTAEGASEAEVRNQLRSKGVWVKHLRVIEGGRSAAAVPSKKGPTKPQTSLGDIQLFESGPSFTELTAFIRQFSTMLAAGVPVVQTLQILSKQLDNKVLGKAVGDVARRIEGGASLADSLKMHPKIFDKVFINLVAAGEVSGSLDKILNRIAFHYEKTNSMNRKVKSAMMYPSAVIVIITIVVLGLMFFVVPKMSSMYTSSGKELPAATQMVIDISNWFLKYWYLVFAGIGGTLMGAIYGYKADAVRQVIDPLVLQIPVFGPLVSKISIARFSRTLSTMIEAGVPIIEGLEITSRVAGNTAIERVVRKTIESVKAGKSLSEPLLASQVFPKMSISMIAVGEQTGTLSNMLSKIAEFYEDEVEAFVSGISSVIEPLLIVFVGIVAASILIPLYMPMFKMASVMGGG